MGCFTMNTHISTYSNKTFTYNILGDLQVKLEIEDNPYQIPLEDLFLMAARINKKRSFLFVSKVLGKHIPILPAKGIVVGSLLAARYLEVVKKTSPMELETLISRFMSDEADEFLEPFIEEKHNPIVIGFAETATALGHSFFEAFQKADFFHTTRELLPEIEPTITFEEEHSHATSHRAYIDQTLLESNREIILVDDELTTGKTTVNIIRSIHEKFPRKEYTVVSILDWRSEENVTRFRELEEELGITIHAVSLVKGRVSPIGEVQLNLSENDQERYSDFSQQVSFHSIINPSPITMGIQDFDPYTLFTGRFGITSAENKESTLWMKEVGEKLKATRSGNKSLVLGTGEYMYIPMKIASYMGENVFYHSTTRSPIYPAKKEMYGVQNRYTFSNPEDLSVQHYVYNILENEYDEIFVFFERKVEEAHLQEMLLELKKSKIAQIRVVYLNSTGGGKDIE